MCCTLAQVSIISLTSLSLHACIHTYTHNEMHRHTMKERALSIAPFYYYYFCCQARIWKKGMQTTKNKDFVMVNLNTYLYASSILYHTFRKKSS